MKMFCLVAAALSCATLAQAQSAAPQTETLTPPTPAPTAAPAPAVAGPSWGPISRSGTKAYLANVGEVGRSGDVTTVKLARVPLTSSAGDYSHVVDDYEFKCAAAQVRIVASTDYDPDGVTGDPIPDPGATWEDIPANSLDAYIRQVACDDNDTPSHWPSVKAFIDAGRPQDPG